MNSSAGLVALPSDFSIDCGDAVKAELLAAMHAGRHVAIDASAINQIDTRALQMLVIVDDALREAGGRLSLSGASQSFLAAAGHIGLGGRVAEWRRA